jgi:energy-coupling factor transporter ATP-binding protein EcfA2
MPTRIERIEMCSFRGATAAVALDLDASKPITLIYGENGTGKSTILDAIDFVLNQEYGSLSDRSSTRPKTHLPSLGSSASKLEVTITAGSKKWTGRLESDGPNTKGPADRPAATVLRRSQVLQFVNEAPKKRYEALQTFISLPVIEKSEAALRRASNTTSGEYNDAATAKAIADESLRRLWEEEGRQGNSPWDWAKSEVAKDSSSLTQSVATLNEILRASDASRTAREKLTNSSERLEAAEKDLSVIEQELTRLEGAADSGTASLISLLEETERYLEGRPSPDACPVCESAERAADLKENVALRLSAMKSLVNLKKKVDAARKQVEQARTIATDAEKMFASAVREMWLAHTEMLSKGSGVDVKPAHYKILQETNPELAGSDAIGEANKLWQTVEECRGRIAARRDENQKTLNQLTAIGGYVTTVETKTKEAKRLESLSKRLKRLLEIVEGHRKTYVDGVLGAIEGLVEQLYSKVHPGEGLGGIRLYLKPNVIGSLEFEGQFQHKSGVPPQAYYSDSHLDTLGICVFLALAKHFTTDNSVIILDDVLTSADSNHLDRLIEMLDNEAASFNQLIITTHYRPWLERYRHSGSKQVGLIELAPWSLSRGVRATKTKLHIEEITDAVKSGDRQAIASKAGILLEELLRFIAMNRGKVPLQVDQKFSLGVLAGSIDSKLAKLLKVEEWPAGATAPLTSTELRPLILAATEWSWVRNEVGAHFSVPGFEIPDADVRTFAERTLELAKRLLCSACGELPNRNKSGSYWECRCSGRRMYPLISPGSMAPAGEA